MGKDPSRKKSIIGENDTKPSYAEVVPAYLDGKTINRLMLELRTSGCRHALRPEGGCTFCGFWQRSAKGGKVSTEVIVQQFETEFKAHNFSKENIQEIDLFISGSFLSDMEMPKEARFKIFKEIAKNPDLKKVLIESRPEFINKESINELEQILGDKILEIGIGLETADDKLREKLKKGFTKEDYEKAVKILSKSGARLLTYVLLKPMPMVEKDAVQDSIETIKYIFDVGKKFDIKATASLETVFVPAHTPLEKEYQSGNYKVAKLWSIIEVLKQCHNLGTIKVGLSAEGLAEKGKIPANCERCDSKVRTAIVEFNKTQNIKVFDGLDCDCKRDCEKDLEKY